MTADDLTTVRLDQFLAHPPAKVWRALTEPELIARWLMPGDFRLEVGHRYTMRARAMPGTSFSGTIQAEVPAFEPEQILRVGRRSILPHRLNEVLTAQATGTPIWHDGNSHVRDRRSLRPPR